ncbi:hypothetical protein C8F04DRAFT_1180781 [Mycena alexandri]|uniref:Uncharacterized protein n=1 Tax=Mycena alexandri TaxID=1745969 RepID=A0AAD6X574_9AGAR|nr:hypothetical protein C8F04DRAFT_1180781 [Mycena alexandri]
MDSRDPHTHPRPARNVHKGVLGEEGVVKAGARDDVLDLADADAAHPVALLRAGGGRGRAPFLAGWHDMRAPERYAGLRRIAMEKTDGSTGRAANSMLSRPSGNVIPESTRESTRSGHPRNYLWLQSSRRINTRETANCTWTCRFSSSSPALLDLNA